MFSKLVSAVFLTALAGRALAFNVTIGKTVFQANETLLFSISSNPVIANCNAQCQTVKSAIDACAVTDNACYCASTTTAALQICELCMFTSLVNANKPAPDVRAGSNQVLAGWSANCNLTGTPGALALSLPPSWDGPFVSVFPTAGGALVATLGGILGISLIYMISNM